MVAAAAQENHDVGTQTSHVQFMINSALMAQDSMLLTMDSLSSQNQMNEDGAGLSSSVHNAVAPVYLTDNGCVAALSDNGASRGSGCSKTLDGAILSTLRKEDAGSIAVGEDSANLTSMGSYLYLIERFGKDGGGDVVVRRLKYTPSLRLPIVFSEANDVYDHNYLITFDARHGRMVTPPGGPSVQLFMNQGKLGWWRARPVTDKRRAISLLKCMSNGSLPVAVPKAQPVNHQAGRNDSLSSATSLGAGQHGQHDNSKA